MIKLVVDCTCEMSVAEAKAQGVICLPMRIFIDNQEYLAGENLTNAEFYQLLGQAKNLPKTMQINPAEYVAALQPLLDAGDEVFVMSISSGLSGTYNSLVLASEQINSPRLKIFDTQTFTLAYYALVQEARKLIQSGVTLDELVTKMTALREKVRIYTIIDNMKYLMKGGRISFAKGLLAAALRIKPIIGVINKKLGMVAKAIGYNAAKKQMLRLTNNIDHRYPVYLGHANASEKAEDFRRLFNFEFTAKREIGPIVGTHGGPGCVGLAYFAL